MRTLAAAGVPLVAALALSSCGATTGAQAPSGVPSITSSTDGAGPAVTQLMHGFWRVQDAAGEPADSWLRLTPLSASLVR